MPEGQESPQPPKLDTEAHIEGKKPPITDIDEALNVVIERMVKHRGSLIRPDEAEVKRTQLEEQLKSAEEDPSKDAEMLKKKIIEAANRPPGELFPTKFGKPDEFATTEDPNPAHKR